MSSSPLYPSPLLGRTIRLLHIEPGEPDSPIVCSLTTKSLEDDTCTYLAISYVWGSNSDRVGVTCNGHETKVTSNLHALLHEFRRRVTIGNDLEPLWVDALCINQNDDDERTSQVRMMQNIYQQADAVIIWLGPPRPDNDNVDLHTLQLIHEPWKSLNLPLLVGEKSMAYDAWLGQNIPDRAFAAVGEFLQTPWFHRIWVVQELLSAKAVVMWRGPLYLDVETMLAGAGHIAELPNVNSKIQVWSEFGSTRMHMTCAGRLALLQYALRLGVPLTMFYLLNATRNFEATDLRDKLFALVGIASDLGEDFVDYSKDLKEISTDLSRRFLDGSLTAMSSQLDILGCITRPNGEGEDMPSWVVDWTLLTNRSLFTSLISAYPSEAPYVQDLPVVEFQDDKSLRIRGCLLSRIAQTVDSPPGMAHYVRTEDLIDSKSAKDYLVWKTASTALVATLPAYPTGESLYDVYWRTLMCNRKAVDSSAPPANDDGYQAWCRLLDGLQSLNKGKDIITRYKRWGDAIFYGISAAAVAAVTFRWSSMGRYKIFLPLLSPYAHKFYRDFRHEVERICNIKLYEAYLAAQSENQIQQREFESSFSQWCQSRRFCVTENGYIGWVPIAARVGDVFVLFAGYRIPMVLREYGDGWRVLGDSYVHGWMDGVEGEGGEVLEGEMLRIY